MCALSDFKNGQLMLVTLPDVSGISMIAVEWCRICFALVPEDFVVNHIQEMH